MQSPGPATIYGARFENFAEADAVRSKLQSLGYDPREISYISDPEKCSFTFDGAGSHVPKAAAEGMVGGAAVAAALAQHSQRSALEASPFFGPIGIVAGLAIGGLRVIAAENDVYL